MYKNYILFSLLLLISCGPTNDTPKQETSYSLQKGEYIYRKNGETLFTAQNPQKIASIVYPWEKNAPGSLPTITKEYFRCKGCSLNPPRMFDNNGEIERLTDCSGIQKHSLPLRDSHEFIYPVLPELLNFVQTSLNKRVVITCGHRCPEHNTYVDPSKDNQYSKHMIGAEVAFYVQGYEDSPMTIINLLMDFYKNNPKYTKEYTEFLRYEKPNSNVAIPPWYNKEVFLKIFNKNEGRNYDNRHPYPYISIQVRHDRDTNEKVTYSWDQATRNYLRY
jgi:hypothetical protein